MMVSVMMVSGLDRADMEQGGQRYSGAVAHYNMKRAFLDQVYSEGREKVVFNNLFNKIFKREMF